MKWIKNTEQSPLIEGFYFITENFPFSSYLVSDHNNKSIYEFKGNKWYWWDNCCEDSRDEDLDRTEFYWLDEHQIGTASNVTDIPNSPE